MKEEKGKGGQLSEELKRLRRRVAELEQAETERKQAEEMLRETRDYLENLINYANAPIIVWDPELRITRFNRAFEHLTGYTANEVVGQEVAMLFPEANREESLHKIARTLSGEYWESIEIPILRKDGETRLALWNSANIYAEDGKTLLTTIAQGTDITERERAEEALRESQEHAQFLADVLERSSQPFAVGYPDGQLMTYNTAYCKLLGYSKEELHELQWLTDLTPPEWREVVAKAAEEIGRTGQPQRFEKEYIRKDGSRVPVEVFAHPIFDGKGNIQYFYSFFTDITERKRAEEELQQSFVKLQRTLEGTVHALAAAVEMKDPYTAGHQRRVTQLACSIAEEMGLSEDRIAGIHVTGLIHDIGKINVPAEILSKPGPLNDTEYNLTKYHPQVGHDILNEIDFPWPVAQIVLQHHERMDGSGYPQGLKGEEILLEARILGVADAVEAMSSHRPYRPARGIDKALEEIAQNKGKLYDSKVADACLQLFAEDRFHFEE